MAMLMAVGLALSAQQSPKPTSAEPNSLEQRIAVIETKLDNLRTLDDRVSKLGDKIDSLSLQLSSVNTKLELIQWFGGALGILVLGYLWKV